MITSLVLPQFDQCVLNLGLIHLCNRESFIGQEIRRLNSNLESDDEWSDELGDREQRSHQITLSIPHPDQQYDGITLQAGLSQGYNLEVKVIADPSQIPYTIPRGGQFIVVRKQNRVDAGFTIAALGIFVRPLALLRLDYIIDRTTPEYQSIVVKHPILRDYPSGWQDKLHLFLNQTLPYEALPPIVNHVDRTLNPDYRPPTWDEVYLAAQGFAGV
jgi:hypothetical protein